MWLTAQLKSPYTNTCSVGNKQEEMETVVQLENCDLIATTETWQHELHNWNATNEDYIVLEGRGKVGKVVELPYYIKK